MKKILMMMLALSLSACATLDKDNGPNQPSIYNANNSFQDVGQHEESTVDDRVAKIGFIEFDDLGFQRSPGAVKNVFKKLRDLNNQSSTPLLMVVFIHGWHHDAKPQDENVKSFKNFLKNLQYEEDHISFSTQKRQVVGVYIGWRGESNESKLTSLTYRSRKSAGLRVGQYGLQEILADLNKVRKQNANNRLVSVGHSFGGGVLYSSVMQNLVDSVVNAKQSEANILGEVDKAYGDLVILMNPALEAARVEVLNRLLQGVQFASCQPLVLASFTAENDTALSDIFPIGQSLFFYGDKKASIDSDLVTTPYGNATAFRTHVLSCDGCKYGSEQKFLEGSQYREAAPFWRSFRRGIDKSFKVGGPLPAPVLTLEHYQDGDGKTINPGSPIMNVYVTGEHIIPNHNDIWGSEFSLFARALIGMEFWSGSACR